MKDSKLIALLSTFEKSEWRQFKTFLESPYFNKRKDLIQLYKYLVKLTPDFLAKKLTNEIVFKKVFPNQPYDDKQLKYVTNYLLKQVERFLVQQRIESETSLTNNFLLEVLVNRQLSKHYYGHLEKTKTALEQSKAINPNYFYYKYQQSDIANLHYILQNLRKYDSSLQETTDALDQFYFLNKLKYSCEMLNRSKVIEGDYALHFIDEVITYLNKQDLIITPLLNVYLQIYFTLKKEDGEIHFETIKELLAKYQIDFPDSENRTIYLYAINYCVSRIGISKNKIYYVEECLQLYLTGIEKGFLLTKGYLSAWTFKNVIRLGLNLKRYEWTEQFIQDSYKKLMPEFQQDALHYNLADLAYRRKNYREAQHHLLLVEYSDIFYNLGAKEMLLKIYYENNEIEALFALLGSFSLYLRRNKKITNNFRATYLNFTALLQQILRAKPTKIPKIIEKIQQTKLLTNRSWLLEICEQLK